MNQVFLYRLKETLKFLGIFILSAAFGFSWIHAVYYFQSHPIHTSPHVMVILAWIFIILFGSALLFLAGTILYALFHLIKWLFIEPFRKDESHGQ